MKFTERYSSTSSIMYVRRPANTLLNLNGSKYHSSTEALYFQKLDVDDRDHVTRVPSTASCRTPHEDHRPVSLSFSVESVERLVSFRLSELGYPTRAHQVSTAETHKHGSCSLRFHEVRGSNGRTSLDPLHISTFP